MNRLLRRHRVHPHASARCRPGPDDGRRHLRTVRYQNIDEDLTTSYLGCNSMSDLGSNVSAGFSFSLNRSSVDSFDADVDLQTFGADIGYRFGPGLTAGAYVQRG